MDCGLLIIFSTVDPVGVVDVTRLGHAYDSCQRSGCRPSPPISRPLPPYDVYRLSPTILLVSHDPWVVLSDGLRLC